MGKDVIVACDFASAAQTFAFLDLFGSRKPFVKIGMELFYAEGPEIVREIKKRGHKIFLDLKLHDIPNTVKKAMAALSALDVDIVNLHAAGTAAMMTAALEGLTRPDGTRPLLIAVTQLTSTEQERMERELWIEKPLAEVVMHYAENAAQAGLDGVVCSPLEAGVVHERCGKDFIIDVRISGDEYTDGGLTLNDMIYVSRRLEKAGVDMIHVSGGTTIKRGSAIPAAGTQQASHAACSREIKKHVNIPVATVGRINEAWIAEELIEDGAADICMMGRANLCDAEFCNKAAAGNADEIRPCIGCLRCLNGIMFGKRISCTVNPDVERDEAGYEPAAEAKNVLVVGAGPAGMEAAYIAAKRGHNVVLVDKQDEPGGEMRIAAVPPAKQELTRVIKYQYRRLAEAGVTCAFGTELSAEDIQRDYAGYEVVLAYGAEPIAPAFMQGFKQVMTADDLLGGKAFPGKKIVIVGGGTVGCEAADYLAPLVNDLSPANRDVTVIEMTKTLAANEGGAGRAVLITRMLSKGVHVLTEAKVTEITEDTISYEKDGEVHTITGADTLVLAIGYRPNTKLADDLAAAGVATHVLGDANKCGNIRDAIGDGYKVACEL